MQLNFVGITAALSAFLGIAVGHVAVRSLEFHLVRLWLPILIFSILGLGLEIASLFITELYAKSALGIIGVTLIWDAVELLRQQRRVKRGYAPANPKNPRHQRFLKQPSSRATLIDYLKDDSHLKAG